MSWIAKPFPLIPGYDTLGDLTAAKWWLGQTLEKWLDRAEPVPQFAAKLGSREELCKFVIEKFEYPMVKGIPTDVHKNNWFSGLECYQITLDYWQKASETLRTLLLSQKKEGAAGLGMGDCEDSSITFVTLVLEKGWKALECLGMVYEAGVPVGGHGWSLFQDEDSRWRIYESTLDEAPEYPSGYPLVNPADNDWIVGGLMYHADAKFDRTDYYEWGDAMTLGNYLSIAHKSKESRRKYQAIERAWRVKTKAIAQGGLLSKIRWRV
jgi:hypothetical protein